ncbi:hypothetical protein GCM10010973_00830 [Cribrihabitans marinus]|nr:hypothetical protein GCM10010973_00830 [Cribrihabitans marinus]
MSMAACLSATQGSMLPIPKYFPPPLKCSTSMLAAVVGHDDPEGLGTKLRQFDLHVTMALYDRVLGSDVTCRAPFSRTA